VRPEEERAVRHLGRAAATTGVACTGVHVATALGGGHRDAVPVVAFVAMAAICLPCVRSLWRSPHERAWRVAGVMYGGMLFVHLLLLTAAGAAAGHGPTAHPADGGTWAARGMWAGLLLAAVEVALAGTVLASGRARGRPLVTC
jgi:hypothetical protein